MHDFNIRPPEGRRRWTSMDMLTIATLGLLLLAAYVQFRYAQAQAEYQEAAEQRGYINRAAICSLQRDVGADLDDICLAPEIVAYFDPDKPASSNSSKTRGVTCAIARAVGVEDRPDVKTVCG